ncbi:glycosyltransferase [Gilvibacter sediminis]|uniref:glycosyltransferase n=1 Tax=Gilvibacter sediminis TaxID=379071 RepID=UPI002350DA95|nr:glycosyltransferase [Gilvibacter sediminis]MDC7998216.1 glycosyltransferase [Gilvibacter sediminis]
MEPLKVLVITYYWPPAGGPGVQRWLKFCTYLPENGVEPTVYIPENPTYPIVDEALSKEVPKDIRVLKHPIWEPYGLGKRLGKKSTKTLSKGIIDENPSLLKKLMLFIRGNFFIPDARKAWVKPSVNYLKDHLTEQHYDVIITTGPPHSVHLIGKQLKEDLAIPWLADFRDPWTTIGYHKSLRLLPWNAKKHKNLEAAVLNTADQILVTSPSTKKEFEGITQQPIAVITNGYDTSNKPLKQPELDTQFSISHIGSLLAKRNPEPLWKLLGEFCKAHDTFKKDLKLVFAGVVAEEVKSSLSQYGLLEQAEFKGYVDHTEAIALQHQSQLLLLLEINAPETRAILPGKLFEYMMARRPILAIGPKGSDIKALVEESGSGAFFNYEQLHEDYLGAYVLNAYQSYKNKALTLEKNAIDQFDRKVLTEQLATVLKSETLARHRPS